MSYKKFEGNHGLEKYFGAKNDPGPSMSEEDIPQEEEDNTWKNFIACVRSRRRQDLLCDIQEGHLSTALGHLGVVSYRTERALSFDSHSERFVNDDEANGFLTRNYRPPYVMPDTI